MLSATVYSESAADSSGRLRRICAAATAPAPSAIAAAPMPTAGPTGTLAPVAASGALVLDGVGAEETGALAGGVLPAGA